MAIFMNKWVKALSFGAGFALGLSKTFGAEPDDLKLSYQQAMYIAGQDKLEEAFQIYQKIVASLGRHDLDLLRKMALQILDKGAKSEVPETRFLALLGAAVAFDESSLYLLENALRGNEREFQLISINFLTQYHNDHADRAIESAMRSPYLIVRIAALQYLCEKQHPRAFSQAEALLCKVTNELTILFPELFFLLDDPRATRTIKRLFGNPKKEVRIATIQSAIRHEREDFVPIFRSLITQHEKSVQEAAIVALGFFKDYESRSQLKKLSLSTDGDLSLAATYALHQLGDDKATLKILECAASENIKALSLLENFENCDDLLIRLLYSNNMLVRVNASLILLKRNNPACLKVLPEIILRDGRDYAMARAYSPGHSFSYIKLIPNSEILAEETPLIKEQSLRIKEEILSEALMLPEKDFLAFSEMVLRAQQNDLVPHVTKLLEKLKTDEAKHLLKTYSQFVGAPLVRNYCNLALFRMGNEGQYKELLKEWLLEQNGIEMIRLRPFLPDEKKLTRFQLTAEETSRLALEALESFVQGSDEENITFILEIMNRLSPANRYVLSGLLIRSTL